MQEFDFDTNYFCHMNVLLMFVKENVFLKNIILLIYT